MDSGKENTDNRLEKGLGLLEVFGLGSGAMIAGLFILPGLAYHVDGGASILSFLIAGLLAFAGMLSEAELASAMPKAGGAYFYITRSMGPAVGTVYGITTWVSISLKTAFFLSMTAFFTLDLMGVSSFSAKTALAAGLCAVFVIINCLDVKKLGRIQVGLFFLVIGVLLVYAAKGIPKIDVHRFDPFLKGETFDMFVAAGLVFVSFAGIIKVGSISEEVRDPGRTIPLAMIMSLSIVLLIYIIVIFVTEGVLDPNMLDGSHKPLSDGALQIFGAKGAFVLSITAIFALLSASSSGLMSASRYPLAAARDQVLPEILGRVNERFNTPHISILSTGVIIVCFLFLPLHIIVEAASAVFILSYILSSLSMIILRESRVQNYQPVFKAPLYPLIQIIAVAGYGFLLYSLGHDVWVLSAAFITGGVFIYWFYGRLKATREYALLHLIERITARDHLTEHGLESELKQVIRERDDLTHDRFDNVIEEAAVMDIEEHMDLKTFFESAAELIAAGLDKEASFISEKLFEREKLGSTVISPLIAIPHVVLEGEGEFKILIARIRDGVDFNENSPRVGAVFVLVSTWDQRNFHLRALAAIAQIVQDPEFDRKWQKAKGVEALRDIILLGARKRHRPVPLSDQ